MPDWFTVLINYKYLFEAVRFNIDNAKSFSILTILKKKTIFAKTKYHAHNFIFKV